MKKAYRAPIAKKIDYAFEEQIMATSVPIKDFVDAWHTDKVCTWGDSTCSVIYNQPKARGLDDCLYPGNIPLN